MAIDFHRGCRGKAGPCLLRLAVLGATLFILAGGTGAQNPPARAAQNQTAPTPANQAAARLSLDRAIELALQHNHTLLAARTTIDQSKAEEVTANLRPNPVLNWDAQFLPIFSPSNFSGDYLNNSAQFDLGVSYLIERGKKRDRRLEAARDQTAETAATVTDNERTLIAQVAQQFINALLAKSNLELAQTDLKSFQNTVDISQAQYDAGGISEGDLLKIKLQLLQFQMDASSAQLAQVQALAGLRALVGFESVPDGYDVEGELAYEPVKLNLDDLKALALRTRPDYHAAQLGVTAAQSQFTLAQADGKRDLTAAFDYSHVAATNTGSVFFNIELPIFTRNQGEIARAGFARTQAQETQSAASETVLTDVTNAFENLRVADQVLDLYNAGYLQQAQDSLDISQYAYQRGAVSLLDYLDAERSYRAAQLAYRQALATHMQGLEQLRQALGTRSLP